MFAGATLWWFFHPAPAPSPAGAIPVQLTRVERKDVPEFIHAVGNVRSRQSVMIRSQVDGQLLALPVKEGQQVKRGDLLARIDDRAILAALQNAKGQLGFSNAQLKLARLDLERYRNLHAEQAISAQVLDQQGAQVEQLEATVRAQEATVAAESVRLSYTRIYSPAEGRVGIRNVDEGTFLRAADANGLFLVTQLDPISVEIALPQSMLPTLQSLLARSVDKLVPVRAFAAADGELLGEGHLELLDNRVSAGTGTIRIKAEFANPDGKLWPDQSVAVTVQANLLRDALVVPQNVVQNGADGNFLYRVRDGRAEIVPVKVVYSDTDSAVILGVAAGETVVLDGQSRLRAGSKVQALERNTSVKLLARRTSP